MAHGDTLTIEKRNAARNRALAAALSEFPNEAAKHTTAAEVSEKYANLIAAHAAALAAYQTVADEDVRAHAAAVVASKPGVPLPKIVVSADAEAAHLALKDAARALHEHRSYWRALGMLAGTRGPVAVENNTED